MKMRMMKKPVALLLGTVLLAGSTLFAGMYPAGQAGTEPSSETAAEEVTEAMTEAEGQEGISSLPGQITMEDILETLSGVDIEKVKEDLTVIEKVVESEDFQYLIAYPQVRELILMTTEKLYHFVLEEPELTAKVCATLGVDEKSVLIGLEIANYLNDNKDEISQLVANMDSGELKMAAESLLIDSELVDTVLRIMKAAGMEQE